MSLIDYYTIWPKIEKLFKTGRTMVILNKMSNFSFYAILCVLANMTQIIMVLGKSTIERFVLTNARK
jgi:hypothetical protein